MRKRTSNFYLGVLVAVISIVAIMAAILTGNSVKTLESGSPQQAVQRYLQAITDGHNDVAAGFFAKDSKCNVDYIDRAYINRDVQVSLIKTEVQKETAVVRIAIEIDTSMMARNTYNEEHTFRLVLESGSWKLSGIPWPLYDCGVVTK